MAESAPELATECPECGDEAVYQRKDEDDCVYWSARGWPDPCGDYDVAINFCPFCGRDLEEITEIVEAVPKVTVEPWGDN